MNKKKSEILIFAGLLTLFVIVQIIYYYMIGIRLGGDSLRYLTAASDLLEGNMPTGSARSFLGYDLFVAFFLMLGFGKIGVVLGQIFLALLAAVCLYQLGRSLCDYRTGVLAVLLYILYPSVHRWNFYILTESLFTSLIIISTNLVVKAKSPREVILALIVVVYCVITRPNGFIVIVFPTIVYIVFLLWISGKRRVMQTAILFGVMAIIISYPQIGSMLKYVNLIDRYADGTIIWGYEIAKVKMQGSIPVEIANIENPLSQMAMFIIDKPGHIFRLAAEKLGYFFLHIRPFYSTVHNSFLVLTLLPIYFFFLIGLAFDIKNKSATVLVVLIICFQSFMVALSFADWDGRHLEVILPMIFVIAASGFWKAFDYFR